MAVNWQQPHAYRGKLTELWASLGKYEFVLPILSCLRWPICRVRLRYIAPMARHQSGTCASLVDTGQPPPRLTSACTHCTLPGTVLFLVCMCRADLLTHEEAEKKTTTRTTIKIIKAANWRKEKTFPWWALAGDMTALHFAITEPVVFTRVDRKQISNFQANQFAQFCLSPGSPLHSVQPIHRLYVIVSLYYRGRSNRTDHSANSVPNMFVQF